MTSKSGYWIGGGLIALGAVAAVAWFVLSFQNLDRTIDDFQRVAVPGGKVVSLDARKYVVYFEGPNADGAPAYPRVTVVDPRTRRPLAVAGYSSEVTYSIGRTGRAIATVTPPRAGEYTLYAADIDGRAGYGLAIGDAIGAKIVRMVVGGFAIGGTLVGIGIAVTVTTAVRRSRARNAKPPRAPAASAPPL